MYRHTRVFVGTLRVADGDALGTIITQPLDCCRKAFPLPIAVDGPRHTCHRAEYPVAVFVWKKEIARNGGAKKVGENFSGTAPGPTK